MRRCCRLAHRLAHFPEVDGLAVGHETERRIGLALGDFGDVVAKLLIRFTRVAAATLRLNHGQHVAAGIVEAVIGDAVPGFGVVAIDRTIVLDPSRMAAQVVSGIGFLGAGTIILRRNAVRGLTTAASVWAVAAIGLASGAGMFAAAVTCTAILLIVLIGLKPVERRMFEHKRPRQVTVIVRRQPGQIGAIEAQVRGAGIDLRRLVLEPGESSSEGRIRLEFRGSSNSGLTLLAEQLQAIPGVRWVSVTAAATVPADDVADSQSGPEEE